MKCTLSKFNLPDSLYKNSFKSLTNYERPIELVFIDEAGRARFIFGNNIYNAKLADGKINVTHSCSIPDTSFFLKVLGNNYFNTKNYLFFICTLNPSTIFSALDFTNGSSIDINIKRYGTDENIEQVCMEKEGRNASVFYVITNTKILKFSVAGTIRFERDYLIKNLINVNTATGKDIKIFHADSLWGKCLGSNTAGAFINVTQQNHFIKNNDIHLNGFSYLGGAPDSVAFWWNMATSMLAKIGRGLKPSFSHHNEVSKIENFIHYNKDTFFATSKKTNALYWYVSSKNKFIKSPLSKVCQYVVSIKKDVDGSFLEIDPSFFSHVIQRKDTIIRKTIEVDKYQDIIYDSVRHNYWAYNPLKIFIHNSQRDSIITKDKISRLGVKRIENIIIDGKFGNTFIKGNEKGENKIILYDQSQNTYKELFKNYNLNECSLFNYNNTIIITGRFGILFSKIVGLNQISDPVVFLNVKDINYKYISDVQISWNTVLLNTDKGCYTVSIPADSEFSKPQINAATPYQFILSYKDTARNINGNDTVKVTQGYYRLQFDLINPLGNGKLQYRYRLPDDSSWQQLNANELTLPSSLIPGKYYTLSIKANDEVWKSNNTAICIYITPYWWQLILQSKLFLPCLIGAIVALLVLLVYITKKIVNRNNLRKNLRHEIELKSVHSQINPHFIFNTLNTALYFIKKGKMEDAYLHVSKFSWLLRAYIKSSKSKYISIADETVNLNNYIQLQQSRFEDKFSYEILVDSKINAAKTKIPALLLQPIVENSIDHGLFHKTGHGHLKIEFKKISLSGEIQCIVEDDGIGRKESKIISAASLIKSESYGDSLIKSLIEIFNKYEKSGISIEYIDRLGKETGTRVVISIKNPVNEA